MVILIVEDQDTQVFQIPGDSVRAFETGTTRSWAEGLDCFALQAEQKVKVCDFGTSDGKLQIRKFAGLSHTSLSICVIYTEAAGLVEFCDKSIPVRGKKLDDVAGREIWGMA